MKAHNGGVYGLDDVDNYDDVDMGFILLTERHIRTECFLDWALYEHYLKPEYINILMKLISHYAYSSGYMRLYNCVRDLEIYAKAFKDCEYIESHDIIYPDRPMSTVEQISVIDCLGLKD